MDGQNCKYVIFDKAVMGMQLIVLRKHSIMPNKLVCAVKRQCFYNSNIQM